MRLLHYNILDGCHDQPARLDDVLNFVARQHADIISLNELNGWDPALLAARAAACGLPHSHLLVGRFAYRIGLMARVPITVLAQLTDGLHHGLLHLRVGDLEFLCTHFSPHERLLRVHEARTCAAIVQRAAGPLVLVGDLNSHSPLDRAMCEAFATPDNRAWALDFEPQQILLDAGLIDTAAAAPDRWTLPTALIAPGCRRRVDYIYINPAFQQRFPATQSRIIHGPEVDRLSDHYPVICAAA